MSAPPSLSWIETLATGVSGFVVYWVILVVVALVEAATARRRPRFPLGPRLKVNLALGLFAAALGSIPLISTLAIAQLAWAGGWGLTANWAWPVTAQVAFSFVVMDLTGYLIHRASHAYPWLWRLHLVHHTDPDMDLSTMFRSHPGSLVVVGIVECAVIATLGLHPLGILAHGLAKLALMALGHASLPDARKWEGALAWLLVTPNYHRIHHSIMQAETDSNYGEVLSIWDRLFGSHSRAVGPVERFGLGDAYDGDASSLLTQLRLPFMKN